LAVQPSLAGPIVVAAIDGLIQYVRVIASEALKFLFKPRDRASHQVLVAAIPNLIAVNQRARHTAAHRFHNMLSYEFGLRRRQLPVPEDNHMVRICRAGDRPRRYTILDNVGCHWANPPAELYSLRLRMDVI
jgi:hypothetical protein